MMNKLIQKLRSRAGESLVESLAALLIFTMASITMYSMVTTAVDINMTAKEADRANQEQMLVAEQGEGTGAGGTVTVTINYKDGEGNDKTETLPGIDVDIYGAEGELYAYYKASGGT